MRQWFVAQTQPLKEKFAQQELIKQGFEVYLPCYKKTRRHARKVDTILSPLFPRYLFVALDLTMDRWRSVNGTRGISYVLTNDERPAPLPAGLVENLKSQELEGNALPLESLCLFSKGDPIFIKSGIFEGQTAIFEGMSDRERVHILLNFLGRETRIKIPLYLIEAP